MKIKENIPAIAVSSFFLVVLVIFIMKAFSGESGSALAEVKVPVLSPQARAGETVFKASCATCHGKNGAGSDAGPPLIHNIYNPGHHGDGAFYQAAQKGVQQHHWRFGNMPPQPEISKNDIANILDFVRETQQANGIFYQQHRM